MENYTSKSEKMRSAAEYLNNTPKFAKKNSLDVIREYLKRLGDPQSGMKIIHVAGTNGKGSVCSFLSSCLQEAGFSVGLFISPHLITIRERMSINGELISEEEFLCAFQRVLDVYEEGKEEGLSHPLYFEYLFLMAMLWFSEKRPDYLILETGLGGRYDATNAPLHKVLTVITRIGLDHTAILGNTLEEIAAEKAGILRKGCPLVFLDDPEEAYVTIRRAAEEIGAPFSVVSKSQWEVLEADENGIDFYLHSRYYKKLRVHIPSRALYQCENTALAAQALGIIMEGMTDTPDHKMRSAEDTMDPGNDPAAAEALRKGLARSFWPGRMEEILPGVFLDGAHNPDGIRAFLETVKMMDSHETQDSAPKKRFLLFSCVKDKQYPEELGMIGDSGLFTDIAAVPMQGGRALSADELRHSIKRYVEKDAGSVRIHETGSVREAVDRFILHKDSDTQVFAAGSLYFIGEVREMLLS